MDARVAQITIIVKDQASALEFYTSKVGFEKKTDVTPPGRDRWVTVGPKGQDLELALLQEETKDASGLSSGWKAGVAPPVVMRVGDCRKTFDELKGRGVKFDQDKPVGYPWGVSATFADPDGNRFAINELPK